MPNASLFPAIADSRTDCNPPELPFALETVHRTVLKLVNPLSAPLAEPHVSDDVLTAIQRLIDIIKTLRSSQPDFLEGLSSGSSDAIATLLPYVTEEAYDVLDALRREAVAGREWGVGFDVSAQPNGSGGEQLTASSDPPIDASLRALLTIYTLIPSLLWQIARSDYGLMRLIEGVSARCWQSQAWAAGMLRLVVMLELEAPTLRWCFDLATGHPARGLLESSAIVQTDEPVLAVQTAHAGVANNGNTSCPVEHQLQAVLQLLQTKTSGLEAFLQGLTAELLQPGANWQTGKLRLRFGLEFTAQTLEVDSNGTLQEEAETIEAELLEEGSVINHAIALPQLSVIQTIGRSLRPATLIRASDTAVIERYAQQSSRQTVAQNLRQWQQSSHADEREQLAVIVQAALKTLACQTNGVGIGLLQPTLLLDELAPRLLWALTRCTEEIMQFLGGLPAQVLQPNANWQQGTLRLLAVLHLTTTDRHCALDLSTGRSLPAETAPLAVGTIVQASTTARYQQPAAIETLTADLKRQWDKVSEAKLLSDGMAVEWLEDIEQDWQPGILTLQLSFSFLADAL